MFLFPARLLPWRQRHRFVAGVRTFAGVTVAAVLLAWPATAERPAANAINVQQNPAPAQTGHVASTRDSAASASDAGAIGEDDLRQLLAGKTFYLRGGYLDNTLSFDEHGALIGHSAEGSYTLSLIEIDKVRLAKHKVELDGVRYGLHFLGALPYENPASAVDRVRITPKKKVVRISIDRELVVKPKKSKEKGEKAASEEAPNTQTAPADPGSVTPTISTTSPAHAAAMLKMAIGRIFASSLDARMMAAMPDFWKLYYQAAAAKTDFRPNDPAVLSQNAVDRKARLISGFEPASNEYAQATGVAGMALYHVVIGADGKPKQIAVARPIGFGLDESAVEAIRQAKFQPAMKDGKPVPVLLDLVVEFRIYSKLTAAAGAPTPEPADKPSAPSLPGPYSAPHP